MTGTRDHAADDGSLARSTGGAAARGAMLIALAVVIGLLLLWWALDDTAVVTADDGATVSSTSAPAGGSGTTTPVGGTDNTTTTAVVPTVTVPVAEPRPAAEVTVLVANGTGGRGVAGGVSAKLVADGYISDAKNANPTADSSIFYDEGYAADARAIAVIIGATPDLIKQRPDGAFGVPADNVEVAENAHVVVIIGSDELIPTA